MFEKVNPQHPDKVADRIAGAIVNLAYKDYNYPRVAVEVLLGHGQCNIIVETDTFLPVEEIEAIVHRIAGKMRTNICVVPQDKHLAENQSDGIRCGDNGIFKGMPVTREQQTLTNIAAEIYGEHPTDGKYIIRDCIHGANYETVICQSNLPKVEEGDLRHHLATQHHIMYNVINPLGEWTGGSEVDCGATNRKLGSDMGDAVTGGGLHGKDLSKADVSVNVWLHLQAQKRGHALEASCAIGDESVSVFDTVIREREMVPYADIVEEARRYIFDKRGGFEQFAEWGLITPYYE